ncbi:MAG TPA: M2 family metallopeptidase, partial [Phenylobacterium sp.]
MKRLFLSVAAVALIGASAFAAPAAKPEPKTAATPAAAKAFVAKAEKELNELGINAAKAEWVYETYITPDTSDLTARASAEQNEVATRYAKQAARFDRVNVDPVTRRKLMLLKNGLVLAAPDRPGAAKEMADLQAHLATLYSTGTATIDGKTLHLEDLGDELA